MSLFVRRHQEHRAKKLRNWQAALDCSEARAWTHTARGVRSWSAGGASTVAAIKAHALHMEAGESAEE
jgi:hypothetical protein